MSRSPGCRSLASVRPRSRCWPTRLSPTRRPSATRATSTLLRTGRSISGLSPLEGTETEMTIDVARSVKKMFVDGKWIESESGQLFDADSPATGEIIAQVPKGTRADAQRAVEAAHKARSAMAKLKGFERSKRLHRVAEAIEKRSDELARLLTLDQGKPLKAEAVGEVADEVAGHPLVDGVGFVGSTETGASVAKRAAGKHVMLELGGNGPQVVFADADIGRAVEGAIVGCYLCAGQSCTAGERILVEEPIRDEFVAPLADAARPLRLGDPFADDTTLGPLNNEGVAAKMDQHVADALKRGAKLVLGGERAKGFPTRLYYHATILDGVEPDMRVSREETFGPIAPIIKFRDEKQALELANDSPYGLLGAVYTKDLSRALRFADALETGWVNINESTNYWEAHLPFGGRAGKKSGIGRVGGRFALEQMTDLKTIVIEISPE